MASIKSNKHGDRASIQLKSNVADRTDIFGDRKRPVRTGAAYQVCLPRLSRDNGSFIYSRNSMHGDEKFRLGLPIMLSGKQNDLGFVPVNDGDDWSVLERDSFLLGFYIFERDFREVKRFIGTRDMGAVLSYYYSKFRRSPEYYKWLECRKIRDEKAIFFGREMFYGRKQNKLLYRLLPRVPKDQQKRFSKVTEVFVDNKMSLQNYVLCLKDMVEIDVLFEVIGIAKQDVTGVLTSESSNNIEDDDKLESSNNAEDGDKLESPNNAEDGDKLESSNNAEDDDKLRSIHLTDPMSDPDNNLHEADIQSTMMLGDWSNTGVDISQVSSENPGIHIWIDLNLPPLDCEDRKGKEDDQEKKQHHPTIEVEKESSTTPTRRSTRVRPLTTRAIEAVAHGYMTRNQRRKTNEANSK